MGVPATYASHSLKHQQRGDLATSSVLVVSAGSTLASNKLISVELSQKSSH